MRPRRRSSKGANGAMLDVVIDDDVSHDDERRARERERERKRERERGEREKEDCIYIYIYTYIERG